LLSEGGLFRLLPNTDSSYLLDFVINLKSAKQIGVKFAQKVLASADLVIK
jgi:ABC-type uncharacterized transport system substrate-binding protein